MKKRQVLLVVLLIFIINVVIAHGVQLPTKVTAATTTRLNQNSKQSTKKIRKLKKRAKNWTTYRFKKQKVILKVRPVQKKFIYDYGATNLHDFKFTARVLDAYLESRWICFDIEGGVEISEEGYESPDWDLEFREFFIFYGYVIRDSKGKVVDKLKYKETRKYMRNFEIGAVGFMDYGYIDDTVSETVDTTCHIAKGKKWRTFYIEPIMYFMDDEEYCAIWEFL